MNKYKKILAIIITLITLASMLLPVCTYATNGSATIYVIRPEDSDGNLITWYTTSKNIFMDKEKHYFNLYCIDAGINRNIDDVKIEEKHITNFCNIDNITKYNIFENEGTYNSMLWFADNLYLWQYDDTKFTAEQIKKLKEENMNSIRKIILTQKDYLKEQGIEITEDWVNNTMFQIINIDKYEKTLVDLNKAICWNLAKNTITDENKEHVKESLNLAVDHIKVKHKLLDDKTYYTECDGNILCLWDDNTKRHKNFYGTDQENTDMQKALKAYYFGMLNAAKSNTNYTRSKKITVNTNNAKVNIKDNKIGPFILENYNKDYIESYDVVINNKTVDKNLYTIDINEKNELYIAFKNNVFSNAGEYDISLKINLNYGKHRNLYIIGNEQPGHQPLLSSNYNGEDDKDNIEIAINTNITERVVEYPSLKITKSVDKAVVKEGDKVVYTIVVENTGNVNLTNVLVTDKMLEINKTIEKLEVGKKEIISKEYTVTKKDIEQEQAITNTATATAKYKDKTLNDSDTATIVPKIETVKEIEKEVIKEVEKEYPSLKITKSVDKTVVKEGDKVVYTIVVENTGNVDLANVLVTDEMLEINKTIEKLEVGKKETISKEYTVTKEDIEAEQGITNTATATVKYKDKTLKDSDTATIVPKVEIIKEVEKEVIKVVEKEVIKEVEKKDPTVAKDKLPNTGAQIAVIISITIVIIGLYISYRKYIKYKKI